MTILQFLFILSSSFFYLYLIHPIKIPKMVRADGGGENILVAECMFYHRPSDDEHPFLSGTSKANCKIEAFWRYVMEWSISYYYNIFSHMEIIGILDIGDEVELFCLHYMFLSIINADLEMTVQMWNEHPISGQKRKSPYQMSILRSNTTEENPPVLDELYLQEYLMPWLYGHDDNDEDGNEPQDAMYHLPNTKVVEPLRCPLTTDELERFRTQVVPIDLQDNRNDYFGRFIAAKEILQAIVLGKI